MSAEIPKIQAETHEVFNQPPPLENFNLYDGDQPLQEALQREGGGWAEDRVRAYGAFAGCEMQELGAQANQNKPVLHSHDRYGHRIDVVEYHPSYHRLMEIAISHGLHALPWREKRAGAHVARAAMEYLHHQAEAGTGCPLTMTFACLPTLRKQPEVAELWEPGILSLKYDPRNVPAGHKEGLTIGMAMTEKQGGSDVRSNTTRAYALGAEGPGKPYELVGHKWFCSAPMSDAFLTLAQTDKGLSCFLLPRWRPDGRRNAFHIQRLKDKLGNHSNASSEVEFLGAFAWMVGEEGRGVANIIEMVALTRFDCMVGSAALMRQATMQAVHHATHRSAFGKKLIDQPLMRNVLADLALESEAALVLFMRVARGLDAAPNDEAEAHFVRLATPVGKYWVCKRTPGHVNEAQECLGGAGYVEDFILARLYREAPLNSLWEGCGNIQCLDTLRAIHRTPESLEAVFNEIRLARGSDRRFDQFVEVVEKEWQQRDDLEYRARTAVERLAVALQASLLIRAGNPAVADAFCAARLQPNPNLAYGTLCSGVDVQTLIDRAAPKLD